MAKIDNELTKRVKAFLVKAERSEEEIKDGALMLLQLNRNRPMYNTIVQRPRKFEAKVVYELKKFLPSREDGLTINEVVEMERTIKIDVKWAMADENLQAVENPDSEVLPYRKGKRADHTELPADIQAIWPTNAERWKRIKELYNAVEEFTDPCDKYEHLKSMKEAWYEYKADFCRYDEYKAVSVDDTNVDTIETIHTVTDQKAINNARSYITKNLPKLAELMKGDATEKTLALRSNIVDRVKLLVATKQEFKQETIDNLLAVGVDVKGPLIDE